MRTTPLTDQQVLAERERAAKVVRRCGALPVGWTAHRAEWLDVSLVSYERALYGETFGHLPKALARPSNRAAVARSE